MNPLTRLNFRDERGSTEIAGAVILALIVVGALGALAIFDPLTQARWLVVLGNFWLPGLILVATAILAAVAAQVSEKAAVSLGLAGVVAVVGFFGIRSWNAQTYYADLAADAPAAEASFQARVPYLVAANSATSSQGGATGQAVSTKHLPGTGAYTTLVERKGGMGPGYVAALSQTFDATGKTVDQIRSAGGVQGCEFDTAAHHRIGGLFTNSLERLVTGHSAALQVDDGDVYAYCQEDGTPMVVVPVTRYQGVFDRHHVPAGVVVYNGKTGASEWKCEVYSGELPGPAVGISYAERINAAMDHRDRTGWISVALNRTGYTDELKDGDADPNRVTIKDAEGNETTVDNTALTVATTSGDPAFATSMSRVASSTSVERLLVLDASQAYDGQPSALRFHKLETPRESNAVLADKVRDTHNNLDSWKVPGTRVQEIAPGPDGDWIASIGSDRTTFYRVAVHADGSMDLTDVSRGTTGGGTTEPGTEGESGSDPALPKVADLTPEQLVELGRMVNEELASRIGDGA